MGEQRLIDANALLDKQESLYMKGKVLFHGVTAFSVENAPAIDPEALPIVQDLREQIKSLKEMNSEYLCMMVDIFDILNAMYGSCGKFCDDCIQEFWDKWGDDSKKSGLSEEEKKKRNKFIRDVMNKKIVFYDGVNKKEE